MEEEILLLDHMLSLCAKEITSGLLCDSPTPERALDAKTYSRYWKVKLETNDSLQHVVIYAFL
jgi:hypothetical protein